MQGRDAEDPVCADRDAEPVTPLVERGADGLRIAIAGGYFQKGAFPEAKEALARVAAALAAKREVEIPESGRARSAAYVITASEGAALHLERLRTRARDFDPAVRDRLIAGAMVPASLVVKAQKFRRWYRAEVLKLFDGVDAILAPASPCTAPKIGQQTFVIDGVKSRSGRISASIPSRYPSSGCRWRWCRFRSNRCRSACRSSPRPGARMSRCGSLIHWKRSVSL
jgi:Asp-tRNA(Asn)/Glu-tRNA(Gln) amidotransferase A subunit family amidase